MVLTKALKVADATAFFLPSNYSNVRSGTKTLPLKVMSRFAPAQKYALFRRPGGSGPAALLRDPGWQRGGDGAFFPARRRPVPNVNSRRS
jgi:hypothetical protein